MGGVFLNLVLIPGVLIINLSVGVGEIHCRDKIKRDICSNLDRCFIKPLADYIYSNIVHYTT